MNKRFYRYIVFFLLIFVLVVSGTTIYASAVPLIDTTHVSVRQPRPDFAKSFKKKKAFQYTKPTLKNNFLVQLLEYLNRKLDALAKISVVLPWLVKIFIAVLFIFVLIIIITKTRFYRIFYSGKAIQNPGIEIASADDAPVDLDKAIRKQVEQKQFRLAIRLLYIKVISQLRLREYILFSQEKTNVDYLRELTQPKLKSEFAAVTSIYNHVWYGDIEIAEDQFLRFEKSFQSLFLAVDDSK